MAFNKKKLRQLVEFPSLGALVYQAHFLVQELKRINDEEYPREACIIRDVLLCFAEHIFDELERILAPTNENLVRARNLGRALHEIHSFIRYLRASSPHQSPPALQVALAQLTDLHFPLSQESTPRSKPICLVRPQWKYNLTYVPLTLYLRRLIAPFELDPDGKLGIKTPEGIIPSLWNKRLSKLSEAEQDELGEHPPEQLAILSFAGLDTNDTLLYSLLAHELGHFIDYSYDTPLHLSLSESSQINEKQVQSILEKAYNGQVNPAEAKRIWDNLVKRTFICLRELLADLLATRMMGFSFFVAQTEFLKTLVSWPGQTIESSGYPGIKFRLSVIFDHLIGEDFPDNVLIFLDRHKNIFPDKSEPLVKYLDMWRKRLHETPRSPVEKAQEPPDISSQLNALIENAVRRTLGDLNKIAARTIDRERCAHLTPTFFERITRLENELPPSCPQEEPNCFAEIMSASWAYQILYGEQRETKKQNVDEQFEEYNKTCRLVLKAIELILSSRSIRSQTDLMPERRQKEKVSRSLLNKKHGVLSKPDIHNRLVNLSPGDPAHLAVVPLDPDSIQAASLDVHLGNWFVVARRTKLRAVELGKKAQEQLLLNVGREETYVPSGKTFLLHPGAFVLGATLEFIALPVDLMAFVEGRSSLGRMGLTVVTAAQVAPGFHGVVVLEFANTGTVPLELAPGISIAQLVFQVMTEHLPTDQGYRGRFHCQIKP